MKISRVTLLCFFMILSACNPVEMQITLFNEYYRAAVHELKQYDDDTSSGEEIINKNLAKYGVAAKLAASNHVDIIVFPEKGLFPTKMSNFSWYVNFAEDIPPGIEKAHPYIDKRFSDRPILRNLSCLAQKHDLFVVATLIDIKKCEVHRSCEERVNKNSCVTKDSDCPKSGYFNFNTLVVFDNFGTLVVRYYKRHPLIPIEPGITTPKYPEPGYFNTGFGSFATDIGLDFLLNNSVIDIEKRPITHGVSYANWWYDHTPLFYFAIPNQQAWSLANNVTVLSSDVHSPNSGSLGSGIYIPGKGALIYSYNPDGRSKLLISNVPKSFSHPRLDKKLLNTKFFYIEDDDSVSELNGEEPRDFKDQCSGTVLGTNTSSFTDYRCQETMVDQYTFIKLNNTEDHIHICSNNFCCSLDYQAESMDEAFYFAVSGNRLNFKDLFWWGVQSCFLARCEPVDGKPCRNFLLKSNTKFEKFNITGSFKTSHIYPHIVNSGLFLSDKKEWSFDGKSQMLYTNINGKNLLHADLYGRLYGEDEVINH